MKEIKDIAYYLTEFSRKLLGEKSEVIPKETDFDYLTMIEKAKQEWLAALVLFNNVSEKDLIDHAIFNLNAAERRYVFLLKEAHRKKKCSNILGREEEP
ncbi:MAG: YaaL family protein [Firmicutes bacterium]|nr:YaaL family protein [Bacillota bacterium]